MQFTLIRQPPVGLAVRGTLSFSSSNASKTTEQGQSPIGSFKEVPTLKNAAFLIPPGTYPLTVTYSPTATASRTRSMFRPRHPER